MLRPVSSIWSPLTRRRWWNHIGDDTALGGITSAMIRRQPDHLNCPSPCPFPPSNPFPFKSSLLPARSPRAAARQTWLQSNRRAGPAGRSVLLCQQAAQQGHTNRRVCGWLATGPAVHGVTKHQVTHQQKPVDRVAGRDTLR